jgi:HD superfamily phosphodiesterase
MSSKVQPDSWSGQVDDVLKEWRKRAVTIILYVVLAVVVPAYLLVVADVLRTGSWLRLGVMSIICLVYIVVAVNKGFDYRLRGWTIVVMAYLTAVVQLSNTGLEGIGRIYLLVTPLFALILIGNRAGLIATALSLIIYGAFSFFAYSGMLDGWILPLAERTDPVIWFTSGFMFLVFLVMNFILLMRMSRFLVNTLKQEHRSLSELEQTYDETLEGWAHALELRDIETAGHCHRVGEITKRLAVEAGLAKDAMADLHRGSLLHDIGKMGIPDSVLLKPGELSAEEQGQMKAHPGYANDLLAHIPYLIGAMDIAYCHHERWDGSGYPRGLKGDDIPRLARVFSVVDVYDELISGRPYREAWPEEKALEYIRQRAGSEFDPAVVEAFVKLVEEEAASLEEI